MADRSRVFQEQTRAAIETLHTAQARFADSPMGMRAAAAELRLAALDMIDSNDRDLMVRLAVGYEQRANAALRHRDG